MTLFERFQERFKLYCDCLARARRTGRLGHAFLLQGESAEVRDSFARLIGQIACCPQVRDGVPCGVCGVCRGLEEGSYPELYTVSPAGRGFQIQVGEHDNPEPNTIRYFEDRFHLTSEHVKIGIIEDADRMNAQAQNALLKTLEEPPANSLFILTTARPGLLLPTTRSRCQKIALIENRCDNAFAGIDDARAALEMLYREGKDNLLAAEAAAAMLSNVASGLRSDADARVAAAWEDKIKRAGEYDASLGKRMEKQREAAAAGEYMRERTAFLNFIQNFCGELYLLRRGARLEDLAAPELLEKLAREPIDQARAEALERAADKLIFNTRFNVNEELALRVFAYRAAYPRKQEAPDS